MAFTYDWRHALRALCGVLCIVSQVLAQDPAVMSTIVKLAEEGNPDAIYALGLAHETGDGRQRDLTAAARQYAMAASAGHAAAKARLAYLYQTGAGVGRDPIKALALYGEAAESDVEAQFQLAVAWLNGVGTSPDQTAGRQRLAKPANAGHQEAQLMLGLMMLQGLGGPKNEFGARRWMQRAAAGRDPALAAKASQVQEQIERHWRDRDGSWGNLGTIMAVVLGLAVVGLLTSDGSASAGGSSAPFDPFKYDQPRHQQNLRREQTCTYVGTDWGTLHGTRGFNGGPGTIRVCR